MVSLRDSKKSTKRYIQLKNIRDKNIVYDINKHQWSYRRGAVTVPYTSRYVKHPYKIPFHIDGLERYLNPDTRNWVDNAGVNLPISQQYRLYTSLVDLLKESYPDLKKLKKGDKIAKAIVNSMMHPDSETSY